MPDAENMPDLEDLDNVDLDEEGGAETGLIGRILKQLWFYHPVIFLVVSLILAGVAYSIWPEDRKFIRPGLQELYQGGTQALRLVMDPDQALSARQMREKIQQAHVDIDLMFQLYEKDFKTTFTGLENPYLIFAEINRYHAQLLPLRRDEHAYVASYLYARALRWEDERAPTAILEDLSPAQQEDARDELAIREQRRLDYLRYQQAVMLLRTQNYRTAGNEFRALQKEWRDRELKHQRSTPFGAGSGLPRDAALAMNSAVAPTSFELVLEDRVRLRFYLGQIHEYLGEIADAEREYNAYLLHAPRSIERFMAMQSLGQIYMDRGHKASIEARFQEEGGAGGARRRAEEQFRIAAEKFGQIVDESAPDTMLRTAYFHGGMAYLAVAENLMVGRETWWDTVGAFGSGIRKQMEEFVRPGWQLPDRSEYVPSALGRYLLESGVENPSPLFSPVTILTGGGLTLATLERKTRRAQREELLARARSFFEGAEGGDDRYSAASRVMIARTLLAQGDFEDARNLFRQTMAAYSDDEVQIACRHGEARSYLLEGNLDRARRRLLGGLEKDGSSAFMESEIEWRNFCRRLYKEGQEPTPGPVRRVWELMSPGVRAHVGHIAQEFGNDRQQRRPILSAMNDLLRRPDLYTPEDFSEVHLPTHARILLARERVTLQPAELEWMNRMILDASFPHEVIAGESGVQFEPMPAENRLVEGLLVMKGDLIADMIRLSRSYRRLADEHGSEARRLEQAVRDRPTQAAILRNDQRLALAQQRRNLNSAIEVNEFLVQNYEPGVADVLVETAEMYAQLAEVVESFPFYEAKHARELASHAARTYLRVAQAQEAGSIREEAALRQAGWRFYAAAQYGRAIETLQKYLLRHATSDWAGKAQNLLGRSYVNLGDYEKAGRIYSSNAQRLTPVGREATYYLGWVYLQELQPLDATPEGATDHLGDPANPLAEATEEGIVRIESALQAFNRIRQLPNIGWDARPWRWATFALGETWYRIADRTRREAEQTPAAGPGAAAPNPETARAWIDHYRRAERYLVEALERYQLKSRPDEPVGTDWNEEPEDYGEIMAARFVTEYLLAKARMELAEGEQDETWRSRARTPLLHVLDGALYPDVMFDENAPQPYYLTWAMHKASAQGYTIERTRAPRWNVRSALGVSEGPTYSPERLSHMRRNAFFLLGENWYAEAEARIATAETLSTNPDLREEQRLEETKAREAYRNAFSIYQLAYDRLPSTDAPQVLFHMGECLRKLGENTAAISKYRLAINTARNLPEPDPEALTFIGPKWWQDLASERLAELEGRPVAP